MTNINEMREYLLSELEEQRQRWILRQENNYSYIFMICNDIGITENDS